MHVPVEPQIREVLSPGVGVDHVSVMHTSLRPSLVAKLSVTVQNVGWSANFGFATSAAMPLLSQRRNNHASQNADPSGFLLVPAKVKGETCNTVERVQFVSCSQLGNGQSVTSGLRTGLHVVARSAKPQTVHVLLAPSWVDLAQNG